MDMFSMEPPRDYISSRGPVVIVNDNPSSRDGEYYISTITATVQLENKITGRDTQGACRQVELIGTKPPVVKYPLLWLWLRSQS
jgi:hypothetical protein